MPTPDYRAEIRVVQNANDPASPAYTAIAAPGSRLACIVESLSRSGTLSAADLCVLDRPSLVHVARCLCAHGVDLHLETVFRFTVHDEVMTLAEFEGRA